MLARFADVANGLSSGKQQNNNLPIVKLKSVGVKRRGEKREGKRCGSSILDAAALFGVASGADSAPFLIDRGQFGVMREYTAQSETGGRGEQTSNLAAGIPY